MLVNAEKIRFFIRIQYHLILNVLVMQILHRTCTSLSYEIILDLTKGWFGVSSRHYTKHLSVNEGKKGK